MSDHIKKVLYLPSVSFFFILSIMFCYSANLYAGSESKRNNNSATIIFLDGTEKKIDEPIFVYEFVSDKDLKYYNHQLYEKR